MFRSGSDVVLFRITPNSSDEAAALALALVQSQPDLLGFFCVVRRDLIRIRHLGPVAGG